MKRESPLPMSGITPRLRLCHRGHNLPDGRVLGKMGHSERTGPGLTKNVEGNFNIGIFDAAVKYFK
jgi:phosphoribosylformylglycinamidine synthase